MRLQNLIIIFIVIALPVILILSVYVNYQIDAANLQASYDSTFLGATYDMLSAFQLNSTNNKYSTVSDSLIRDIEASINVFSNSFGTGLGLRGTSKANVMNYVPAILFTLYDGYYIYTPTRSPEDLYYEHALKPYIYYTEEYVNGKEKIVINYTLDNYVAVYYDNDEAHERYQSRAGYLEVIADRAYGEGVYAGNDNEGRYVVTYNGIEIPRNETLRENEYEYSVVSNDGTVSIENFRTRTNTKNSTSAYDYYVAAYEFTNWYNNLMEDVKPKRVVKREDTNAPSGYREETKEFENILKITKDNPVQNSDFNDERIRVIQDKITNNLIQAMATYGKKSTATATTPEFNMPQFTVYDWDKILNNVCVVSFVQGLVTGTTTYNNYAIIPSTENEQHVSETDLYYIAYQENSDGTYETDGSYHRIGCPHLGDGLDKNRLTIVGYNRTEFSRQVAIDRIGNTGSRGSQLKEIRDGSQSSVYYYPHTENACYYCVINAMEAELGTEDTIEEKYREDRWLAISPTYDQRRLAYYRALARERRDIIKASEYINASKLQQ